eukprot:TRINITY_DN2276_c0_g5_i1.p1 TRINITY_DN2276_c0_g5~~TRINITY_DN2276_c0_g5_i1.p1  ORF type:complete len:948 (-),score=328.88 TRINITY_DN2276_c0_g5_i1:72-2915(-)
MKGSRPKDKDLPSKRDVFASVKMKRLQWSTLATNKIKGSFWATARDIELDGVHSDLEGMFAATAVKKLGEDIAENKPKSTTVSLLDMQRANNISIVLSPLKLPIEEIRAALIALDETKISIEVLAGLRRLVPTKEEIELLKDHPDKDNFGFAERFFYSIMSIPRYADRMQSWLFKMRFAALAADAASQLEVVTKACVQVRTSTKLAEVLEVVLAMGNFINGNQAKQSYYGFRIDGLSKLGDTRSTDNKRTLLHFFATLLERQFPLLRDFYGEIDLSEKASRVVSGALKVEIDELAANVRLVRTTTELVAADPEEDDRFADVMQDFLRTAEGTVAQLLEARDVLDVKFKEVVTYYAQDEAITKPEELFQILFRFYTDLTKARADNARFEKAALAAQKRAEAARLRLESADDAAPAELAERLADARTQLRRTSSDAHLAPDLQRTPDTSTAPSSESESETKRTAASSGSDSDGPRRSRKTSASTRIGAKAAKAKTAAKPTNSAKPAKSVRQPKAAPTEPVTDFRSQLRKPKPATQKAEQKDAAKDPTPGTPSARKKQAGEPAARDEPSLTEQLADLRLRLRKPKPRAKDDEALVPPAADAVRPPSGDHGVPAWKARLADPARQTPGTVAPARQQAEPSYEGYFYDPASGQYYNADGTLYGYDGIDQGYAYAASSQYDDRYYYGDGDAYSEPYVAEYALHPTAAQARGADRAYYEQQADSYPGYYAEDSSPHHFPDDRFEHPHSQAYDPYYGGGGGPYAEQYAVDDDGNYYDKNAYYADSAYGTDSSDLYDQSAYYEADPNVYFSETGEEFMYDPQSDQYYQISAPSNHGGTNQTPARGSAGGWSGSAAATSSRPSSMLLSAASQRTQPGTASPGSGRKSLLQSQAGTGSGRQPVRSSRELLRTSTGSAHGTQRRSLSPQGSGQLAKAAAAAKTAAGGRSSKRNSLLIAS